MRSDMFKVIVERERRGGGKGRSPNKNIPLEDRPSNESMRFRHIYGGQAKELNENLSPLWRFLCSKVGQKWDDVFSEICENISTRSTVQQHVRDHVMQYVETNVGINEDGLPYDKSYPSRWIRPRTFYENDLYVHPVTRILSRGTEKYNRSSWRTPKVDPDKTKIGKTDYVRHKGLWYQVVMKKWDVSYLKEVKIGDTITKSRVYTPVFDVFGVNIEGRAGGVYYAAEKKQLNSKDLRKLGLENDPDWKPSVDKKKLT
jgi:hypothetical protein